MKPDEDFQSMFAILDAKKIGFLLPDEIARFYENLFFHQVEIPLVNAVLQKVCNKLQCPAIKFQEVLLKLEEWRIKESNAYWDFKGLDVDGSSTITLGSALLLARSLKSSEFSLQSWRQWTDSRQNSGNVSWEEFKGYLYFQPGASFKPMKNDNEFRVEFDAISNRAAEASLNEYQFYKESLENDESYATAQLKDRQQYQDDVQYQANRLTNRWNVGGVEAVIHDDGTEMEMLDKTLSKDEVTVTELFSALDEKYDLLRNKLMWEMVKLQSENESDRRKVSMADMQEKFSELQSKEKELRRSETLEEDAAFLYGGTLSYNHSLVVLMGDTTDAHQLQWEVSKRRYDGLVKDGKSSSEIREIFERENLEDMRNASTTSGQLLTALWRRQKQEKDHVLLRLNSIAALPNARSEKIALFAALYRQSERAREGHDLGPVLAMNFDPAASGVAVAERKQEFDPTRFSADELRQERLAIERIRLAKAQQKQHKPPEVMERLAGVSQAKDMGPVAAWMELVRLLEAGNEFEREMLIHFLHNKTDNKTKNHTRFSSMNEDDLQGDMQRLRELYDNWKQAMLTKSLAGDSKAQHFSVLHEACAIYVQLLRKQHNGKKESELLSVVLGRLQTVQDVRYQEMAEKMKEMTPDELYRLRKSEYRVVRDQMLSSIGCLLFHEPAVVVEPAVVQPVVSPEEQQLRDVINKKYDVLRAKLFEEALERRGITEKDERDSAIVRFIEEERELRGKEKKQQDFYDKLKVVYSSLELFGPLLSLFRSASSANQDSEKRVTLDEAQFADAVEHNVITELERRCDDEIDLFVKLIKESDDVVGITSAEVARQSWMTSLIDSDVTFASSAVGLVAMERKLVGKEMRVRLRQDMKRFIRSTQERFQLPTPFNLNPMMEHNLTNATASAAQSRLCAAYPCEWLRFRDLMGDVTAQELREAASSMTSEERVTRLAEINVKRRNVELGTEDGQADLLSLLEEASAIKHVARQEILRHLADDVTDDDVIISLLADLQEEQLDDAIKWHESLTQGDDCFVDSASDKIASQLEGCENIFNVLCKYEGLADDDRLMQALEDKYDALRDKVLADALMKQIGAERWRRMSERERQERLLKLKMEERRLRREGKWDELAKLLGDAFADDARMKSLMGESREEYERRLKERLEARKRGESVPDDDDDLLGSQGGANNPLEDLSSRFEEERDALMRMLNGQDGKFMSEKERQLALVRLRQARLRALEEERYDAAALVSGLIGRQAKDMERMKGDRERQRAVARQRLIELRKRRSGGLYTITEEDEEIERSDDRDLLEDAVLKKINILHTWERSWMSAMLVKNPDPLTLGGQVTPRAVRDKIKDARSKVPKGEVTLQEHFGHLAEAALYRQVGLSRREESLQSSESRDELDVLLLAELQDTQDARETLLSSKIPSMSNADLISEQERIVATFKAGRSQNVPETILTSDSDDDVDADVTDAVQGKFDAIIEAAAAKAMLLKVGESNWSKMSLDERAQKVNDLASRVKDLIAAGRYDDALALLGDGLSEEDRKAITALLLGNVDERRKKDLAERQKRMKERIANGMSKEEAMRLFDEEGLMFEDSEKKRRRNVLEGLFMDVQSEKEALMRSLKDANDKMDAERIRQAFLAKLRLQERQLRREKNLDSVALLLAMSRGHNEALEKDKQRQLALARDRLEAHKRRKADGSLEENDKIDSDLDLDTDDVKVLADVVLREMEAKHAAERNTLMQIFDSTGPESEMRRRAGAASSSGRRDRVKDLREMRRQWRNEDPETLLETSQEQMDILKEASALQTTSLCLDQKRSEDEARTLILADLQNVQRKEENFLIEGLLEKSAVVLRKLAQVQRQARAHGWQDNVAGSLLGLEDATQRQEGEAEVMKALDEKYDALKDKLLAEALMKKLGEKEWQALSERERQKRIAQIKQHEKKLRMQGRHDEVARLFKQLSITEEDVSRLFGDQRESQQDRIKKRIEELMEERKRKGLPVDDNEIEKQVEEEEKIMKKKRKNVLLSLDRNLESEREALLATLRRQDEAVSEERRRQLALAKLRRDRRQMETEEKYSAVALVFQAAKQDEATLSANFAEARARQKELASVRLAARKQQKKRKDAIASLTDPNKILKKLEAIAAEKLQGSPAEHLFHEIEMRQEEERETLILLLLASDDPKEAEEIEKMEDEALQAEIVAFRDRRKKWRQERLLRALNDGNDRPLVEGERERLSKHVAEENKAQIRTIALLLEAKRRELPSDLSSARESTSVDWLADLQHNQDNETTFTTNVIADKGDEYVEILSDNQMRSRRECWNDNICRVVFGLALPWQDTDQRPPSTGSIDQESKEALEKIEDEMSKVEDELEQEKKDLEKKKAMGEDIDTEAAMSALERQYAAKKAALSSDLEEQRAKIRERIRERKQRKDESEFDAHAAAGMVLLADERMKSRKTQDDQRATSMRSLMEERLAARRENRRIAKEKEEQEKNVEAKRSASPIPRDSSTPPSSGGARELLNLVVPEEDKEKQLKEIFRRSQLLVSAQEKAQKQQRDNIQQRLKDRKNKTKREADELFQMHEREKTRMDLRMSRQKTMLIERVSKIRTERTMTMKEKGSRKAEDFKAILERGEDGSEAGMTDDQRMNKIAEKLQKKFQEESHQEKKEEAEDDPEVPSSSKELNMALGVLPGGNEEDEETAPQTTSQMLDKSAQERKIKERRLQKKKSKREKALADPDQQDE